MSSSFKKLKNYRLNRGMTYVELIVVLSIFSVISTVVMFSYGDFQARVDIKNLASDIALKFVEAQKAATFGRLPSPAQQVGLPSNWKPSYGIHINRIGDNKSLVYFVDLNSNSLYEDPNCTGECVEKVSITKNNTISNLEIFYLDSTTSANLNDATVTFTRPDSIATIKSSPPPNPNISYLRVTVNSPQNISSFIRIYPSGRIQVN